jgi:hypothetical protein
MGASIFTRRGCRAGAVLRRSSARSRPATPRPASRSCEWMRGSTPDPSWRRSTCRSRLARPAARYTTSWRSRVPRRSSTFSRDSRATARSRRRRNRPRGQPTRRRSRATRRWSIGRSRPRPSSGGSAHSIPPRALPPRSRAIPSNCGRPLPSRLTPAPSPERSLPPHRQASMAGILRVLELQPAGGRRMDAAAFVAGHRIAPGMRFAAGRDR